MRATRNICLLSGAATLTLVFSAYAADPAAAIKYRQNTMTALGGHMSAANAILKGEAGQKSHLSGHLDGILAAAKMTQDLFPAGTDKGQTDALPAIWERTADFDKAVESLEAASARLAAVRSGDPEALKAAFGNVGKACKSCHDSFRRKK